MERIIDNMKQTFQILTIPTMAICAIVGVELYALHLGHNGTALSIALSGIGGIGGFYTKQIQIKWRKNNENNTKN